jgi:MFS family permease
VSWRPAGDGGRSTLVLALVLMNGLYAFNQMLVVPILPVIEREFDETTARVTWILSVFLIVSCVATPILGRLSDQFGRRRLLLGALVSFLAGSVLAALAPNLWVLVLARVLQAASGALTPLAIGMLRDLLPREAMHRAIGGIMSAAMIGSGLGAAVSGLVADLVDWRLLFGISSAVIAVLLAAAWRLTPRDRGHARTPVDVRGAVLLSIALVSILVALTEGDTWGWLSPGVLGLVVVGAAAFAVWQRVERGIPHPLVDVRVLAQRSVLIANVAQSLSAFAMTALIVLLPRIVVADPTPDGSPGLDLGYGLSGSLTDVGLYLLPIAVSGVVAGPLATRLRVRWGLKRTLVLGQLIGAAALAALIPWHDTWWQIVLVALGFGLTIPIVNTAVNGMVVDSVPAGDVGVSTGVLVVFRQIGSSTGSQLTAAVLTSGVIAGTTLPTETAFQVGFGIGVAGALIGTLLVLGGVRGGQRAPRSAEATAPSR